MRLSINNGASSPVDRPSGGHASGLAETPLFTYSPHGLVHRICSCSIHPNHPSSERKYTLGTPFMQEGVSKSSMSNVGPCCAILSLVRLLALPVGTMFTRTTLLCHIALSLCLLNHCTPTCNTDMSRTNGTVLDVELYLCECHCLIPYAPIIYSYRHDAIGMATYSKRYPR